MNVLELTTALLLQPPDAPVLVAAPLNPVLNKILALGTVDTAALNGEGNFMINLAQISTTFRISAPFDTALSETLENTNILGVDTTTEPGTSHFQIDT
jgi:hypothetical protein